MNLGLEGQDQRNCGFLKEILLCYERSVFVSWFCSSFTCFELVPPLAKMLCSLSKSVLPPCDIVLNFFWPNPYSFHWVVLISNLLFQSSSHLHMIYIPVLVRSFSRVGPMTLWSLSPLMVTPQYLFNAFGCQRS